MKNESVSYFIAKRTVPWLLIVLFFSCTLLFLLAKILIDTQIEDRHFAIIEQMDDEFAKVMANIKQQVVNISNNELIINSLIDFDGRENYIPLFIRSFMLAGLDKAYISVTNFSGKIITHNSVKANKELIENTAWKDAVLNKSQVFSYIDDRGLIIAAPIMLSGLAEGAVVVTASLEELSRNISLDNSKNILAYIDHKNRILYSSSENILPLSGVYKGQLDSNWFVFEKSYGSYKIVSAELKSLLYSKIYFLLLFMVAAIFIAIFSSLISIFLASKLVSKTLNNFVELLKIENRDKNIFLDKNDPDELLSIYHQFEGLSKDLSEAHLLKQNIQSILNSLNECLIVFDIDGNTQLTNHAFDRLSDKIALDKQSDFTKIIPVDYRQEAIDTNCSISDFEYTYSINATDDKEKKSQFCIIHWSRSLYYAESGSLEGVILIGVDVTQAREIEKDLHLKNRAIEEASNGIVIADALQDDMPLIYSNNAFLDMCGYSKDEILGKNCRFLQGDKTDKASINKLRKSIKNGDRATETLLNYRKDGSKFYNHLMLTPIKDIDDNVTHYLGIQLDVTDRVESDKELQQAKMKAEESVKLKSQFLANMSHEIRTPMNGVLGMLGLLQRTDLTQQQAHYAGLANSSAESLLVIINDILDFSKVEAGKIDLESIDFNLLDMLGDLAEAMAPRAQEKAIELVLDFSQVTTAMVKGDPGRVRQIITNLVSNAIKFTTQGEVVIQIALESGSNNDLMLKGVIIDTGIGIPEDKLATLFDSFSQVDASTTRKYGGTGLGLAIVKQLCELMGGNIKVISQLNHGSQFHFSLKLQQSLQTSALLPAMNITDLHLLIVDDNDSSRRVLVKQFQQWGANVAEAVSGVHGIQQLEEYIDKPFTMAIIDLHMPEMDGETLVKHIRNDKRFNDTYLVMMSPLNQQVDHQQFSAMGCTEFFPKPATLKDLHRVLNIIASKSNLALPDMILNTDDANREISEKATSTTDRKQHLLLVEDNIINQQVALGILEILGYTADIAENGLQALALLRDTAENSRYDLVLMDCQMPEMDGYDATKAIRKDPLLNSDIPIIAMTANAMKGDKEKCLAAGMSDYISKPIDPDMLSECLQRWLNYSFSHSIDSEKNNHNE